MRNRISFNTTDEQFLLIVKNSISYSEVCRNLGLRIQGSNYQTIKQRILRQKLSTVHFNRNLNKKGKTKRPIEELLVLDSKIGSCELKKRLIKEGILQNKCAKCGLESVWQNEPITLQLDHINGNHRDCRRENLRILCPNCHTQTKTHSGKRLKKAKRTFFCPNCNKPFAGLGKSCLSCWHKERKRINFPPNDILSKLIWQINLNKIAESLDCGYTSLKNYCLDQQIQIPPMGYWLRRKAGYDHEKSLKSVAKIRKPMNLLTNETVKEIRLLFAQGLGCRKIGRKLNIHHTKISAITRGKSYIGVS